MDERSFNAIRACEQIAAEIASRRQLPRAILLPARGR